MLLEPNLIKQNVSKIKDFISEQHNRFWTHQEFVQQFNINVDFLTYHRILSAIPQKWKETLGQLDAIGEEMASYRSNIEILISKPEMSQKIYWSLLPEDQIDSIKDIWENDLDIQIDQASWEKICFESPRTSNCPKLRYFQYRLLQKKLVTNHLRSKWDSSVSASCSFCLVKKETPLHLFCECPIVVKFWKSLFKWLKYTCKIDLLWEKLDFEDIMFNNLKGRDAWFINTVLLTAKQYIYANKCLQKKLKIIEFVTSLVYYQKAEKLYAIKSNKHMKHNKKWKPLICNL